MMKTTYSYANAVAISAQKTLIPKSKFVAMSEAKTASEAYRLLVGGGAETGNAGEYETLVENERVNLKKFLLENSPNKDLIYYAYARADVFNCDVAVRRVILGVGGLGYSSDGLVNPVDIESYLNGDGKVVVPDYVKRTVDELKRLCKNGTPSGIELSSAALTAQYRELKKLVKNPVMRDLIRAEIDAKNVSVYFRSANADEAERQFIVGGKLKKEKLRILTIKDDAKIRNAFLFTSYYEFIDLCLRARSEGRPLSEFERAVDEIPLKRLDSKRYSSSGVVPMLLYYLYKTAEMKNVRTVMSGKLVGASAAQILGRLRYGYVG